MPNVGGVLYNELLSANVEYFKIVGKFVFACSIKSLRIITTVTPEGPKFFVHQHK